MAKSLRSKAKRACRSKKRESGKYAAAEAARLQRLNAKLVAVKEQERPTAGDEEEEVQDVESNTNRMEDGEGMSVEPPKAVSTHGPRGSRREAWRKSKGMEPIPKRRGMNRQGGLAARRKAGRPSRRR